ncbi:hypothetical protein OHB35_01465 [Streptomyces phaeochromogenes]|uniref:Uncharacterized protein n=1 Tax=Streptomyces phaeochromogenes TaxID=1923 RepID=A0ABZ1H0E6_STRPH|nr:hypothetical protein [Streptomyces phaeochromogenes]WSD11983.1 hypothetical protein OHB35_01465 [Streptomyces phaeochromogenes]
MPAAAARKQAQSTVDAAARQADAAWAAGQRLADAAWAAGQRQADAAWEAGRRQADAAWEAGRLQADAQLDVARETLTAQHLTAQREVRRAAYAAFLAATDAGHQRRLEWQQALGTSEAAGGRDRYRAALSAVTEALTFVRLEGPDPVSSAAEALESSLDANASLGQYQAAHADFLDAARTALAAP